MPSQWFFGSVVVFLVFCFVGCSGNKVVKHRLAEKKHHAELQSELKPDWILNTPINPGFLYGVGSAEIFGDNESDAIARAKDIARIELIKQIEVKISGTTEQKTSESLINGKSDIAQQLSRQVNSQVPEFTLMRVTSIDNYKSANTVATLVQLDINKELQNLQGNISDLDQQINDHQQAFKKNNLTGMSAIRLVSPVLVLVDQRAGFQSRHNALASQSIPLLSQDIRQFVSQLHERIRKMKVSLESEGEDNPALRNGLMNALTEKGLSVSDSDNRDLTIVYRVNIDEVKRGNSIYAITTGNITIKDESNRVIKTFKAKSKGVSSDPAVAQARAIKKLSQQLSNEMMFALFN